MRLVTFQRPDGIQRAGALIDADQAVLDLAHALRLADGGDGMAMASVLGLIEGGEPALAQARSLVARAATAAVTPRSAVKLLAPIQPPPQMRDCSCFELLTIDELGDPYDLDMSARVNGEEWGRGNTRDMPWTFEDVIAHVSRSETLHPGEFHGSGTVGNGCGLEQLRYLKPNDVVELEVQGIGILRTRITKPDSKLDSKPQ